MQGYNASMFDLPSQTSAARVLTVSDLNRRVRECLETAIPLLWVAGEISNLSHAASGHVYFTLKDDGAQVRCVMWRSRAQLLGRRLQNGQQVEVRALPGFYEARGEFQLTVETVRQAGQGSLFERFLELKSRLEREGLFAAANKRPLPAFPRRIGIVTSPQAAALRDVLATLQRRSPHVALALYPTQVQGDGAAVGIATAIAAAAADGNDVLILCRGGGSLEDLWAFNEEAVARAIRSSAVPVVSGIGHETDFTIADFAADLRAATPTAAAELAGPDRAALLARLAELERLLRRRCEQSLAEHGQRLDWLAARLVHPAERLVRQHERLAAGRRQLERAFLSRIESGRHRLHLAGLRLTASRPQAGSRREHLEALASRLKRTRGHALEVRAAKLRALAASLNQLDPLRVLARGYTLALAPDGRAVRDAGALQSGDRLQLVFARGKAAATVDEVVAPPEAD